MAKNSYTDWDATAGNNLDIGGISIAEGCASANINNALREMMGQLATYQVVSLTGTQTLTNKTLTAPVISGGTIDDAVIGGATPDAGTFTVVTVTGTTRNINVEDEKIAWGVITGDYVTWVSTEGFVGYENGVLAFRIGSNATTMIQSVYDNTSAAAANVFVGSGGNIYRSTSSGEYKIARAGVDGDLVLRLNPITFTSTHEADNGARLAGFVAEEVAEVFPEASADDGKNYDVRAIVAALVAKVQEMETRLLRLEAGA